MPLLLAGPLDEQRHRGDLVDVRAVHLAAVELALLERDAVVGGPPPPAPRRRCRACLSRSITLPSSWSAKPRLEQVAQLELLDLALVLVALARDAAGSARSPSRRYWRPSGRYCHGTCGSSTCLKFSVGRLVGGSSPTHSSKRLVAVAREVGARVRLRAVLRAGRRRRRPRRRRRSRPMSPTPLGGPPRCRAVRPRGRTRLRGPRSSTSAGRRTARPAGRPRRGRAGRPLVASSDTFIVWLLPSSAKMLFGCSEAVGSLRSITG